MSSAVIIAAGEFPRKPYPLYLLQSATRIVCCDGAFAGYLRRMPKLFGGAERLPDAVVGDMDSLPKALQERYSAIILKESEQDDNDQTKAVRYVLTHYPEVSEIHILGATGRRADHTIGNLSLLMEYPRLFAKIEGIGEEEGAAVASVSTPGKTPHKSEISGGPVMPTLRVGPDGDKFPLAGTQETLGKAGANAVSGVSQQRQPSVTEVPSIDIVSDYGTAFAIFDSIELHVGAGRRVSLFSPDNSLQIRSEGLQWPTDGVVFDNWWKATLNRATADIVRLTFSHPSRALVILD